MEPHPSPPVLLSADASALLFTQKGAAISFPLERSPTCSHPTACSAFRVAILLHTRCIPSQPASYRQSLPPSPGNHPMHACTFPSAFKQAQVRPLLKNLFSLWLKWKTVSFLSPFLSKTFESSFKADHWFPVKEPPPWSEPVCFQEWLLHGNGPVVSDTGG